MIHLRFPIRLPRKDRAERLRVRPSWDSSFTSRDGLGVRMELQFRQDRDEEMHGAVEKGQRVLLIRGSVREPGGDDAGEERPVELKEICGGAAKTVAERPASFKTLPRRSACAVVSGWPATCRIRNGGIPFPFATCVTAEKSRCFAGSLPNFSR